MSYARLTMLGLVLLASPGLIGCPIPLATDDNVAKAGDDQDQAAENEPTSVPAGVGVGRKGHSYGSTPLTAPASAYWRAEEKIAFEIQVPHALNLYKALEGEGPADHEEFMEKIIQANNIKLPELPENKTYRYDPDTEVLMVDTVADGASE